MPSENEQTLKFLTSQRDKEREALRRDAQVITEAIQVRDTREVRIKYLDELIAGMSSATESTPALTGLGKYTSMTVREGILDVLSQTGSRYVRASEIAERLRADGAKSASPNFSTIVLTECKRLQEKLGKLERGEGGFRLKVWPSPVPVPPSGQIGVINAA